MMQGHVENSIKLVRGMCSSQIQDGKRNPVLKKQLVGTKPANEDHPRPYKGIQILDFVLVTKTIDGDKLDTLISRDWPR